MGSFSEALQQALLLIVTLDGEILRTVWTSLFTSVTAILVAAAAGVPIGAVIGLLRFPGRRGVLTFLNTLLALPTVVVGLLLFGLFSRQGPLGPMGLLFTPWAMIAGQIVLSMPIVASYTVAAVAGADPRILPTAQTLGAGRLRWLRPGDRRGRGGDDARRQHSRLYPDHDHRHRPRDQQGRVCFRLGTGDGSARRRPDR